MDRVDFSACLEPEEVFKLRSICVQVVADKGLLLDAGRIKLTAFEDYLARPVIRAVVAIATQEEEVFDYPADWWQAFKERWFPRWLKKRYPVRRARVWAIHKYPELAVPNEFVGREFVHFRVINEEKLRRKLEE